MSTLVVFSAVWFLYKFSGFPNNLPPTFIVILPGVLMISPVQRPIQIRKTENLFIWSLNEILFPQIKKGVSSFQTNLPVTQIFLMKNALEYAKICSVCQSDCIESKQGSNFNRAH